jgi:hypothetical protein
MNPPSGFAKFLLNGSVMAAKPIIESSAPLSVEESRELVLAVSRVRLTESRRKTLTSYAAAAKRAFEKRLTH